jgi:hypothetical protein
LGNVKIRDHLGDPGVDGRIILKFILEKWIHLSQDKDQLLALVNTIMNLQVP